MHRAAAWIPPCVYVADDGVQTVAKKSLGDQPGMGPLFTSPVIYEVGHTNSFCSSSHPLTNHKKPLILTTESLRRHSGRINCMQRE